MATVGGEGSTDEREGILSFEVGESWRVDQLTAFLGGVSDIYDVFLIGALRRYALGRAMVDISPEAPAEPLWAGGEAGFRVGRVLGDPLEMRFVPTGRDVTFAGLHVVPTYASSVPPLAALVNLGETDPDLRLRVHRIEMASPGAILLKGLGEPIKETNKLIKDAATIDVHRKKRKEELKRAQEDTRHLTEMNRLEEDNARMDGAFKRLELLDRTLTLALGPNWRETEQGQATLQKLLASMGILSGLHEEGLVALPPGVEAAG